MEIIKEKINSRNGEIAIAVHKPEKQSDKLLILCPGFLDSKDYRHLVVLAEDLCSQGYTAVRFDPIGTWESEYNDNEKYTITQYLEDVRTVLEYMLEKYSYKKIVIGGHSRGGRISILYAARDPRVSLVLAIMPSYGNFEGEERIQWEKSGIKISKRDALDGGELKEFKLPFAHVLDMDKYDVIADTEKVKIPIIFVAGELDDLVTPRDVMDIFDNAGELKTFVLVPGVGHNYRRNEDEIKIMNGKIIEAMNLIEK